MIEMLKYVEWVDSAGTGSWGKMTYHAEATPKTIRTVGWVLRDSKDSLVIAQSVDDLDADLIPMADNSICIPRFAITEEYDLPFKKGSSNKAIPSNVSTKSRKK